MRRVIEAAVVAALLVLVATADAWSHDAPSGWAYDRECCGGYDCAQVADAAVREVLGGYQVTILPGSHPMLPAGSAVLAAFVPHGDGRIRASGDRWRHVCIVAGRIGCVYVPPGGV